MPHALPDFEHLIESPADFAIAAAVLAYATGDAFGVAYEFQPMVKPPVPKVMLGKDDWPAGGVSDDTLLSLMTIECLRSDSATEARHAFIAKLREAAPTLRGLGPTTRHALGMHVEEREVGIIGVTNGGMMRTALLSLAFESHNERQEWVGELCKATHEKPEPLKAALDMAEVFALALADESAAHLEAQDFEIPETGVSLNPQETFQAVLAIANSSQNVWQAYEKAICAGGDTDTVAALSSALVALRNPESFYELPFIADVNWPEIPEVVDCIKLILDRRKK